MDDEAAAETKAYEVVDENEEENKEEPGENIAEAAEKAAAEAEASGAANPDEEVKISLTVFEDEDLGDLPDEEDEEEENASYVDLDLWMGYFIEVLCYNNPLMSACSRGA